MGKKVSKLGMNMPYELNIGILLLCNAFLLKKDEHLLVIKVGSFEPDEPTYEHKKWLRSMQNAFYGCKG